MLRFNWFFACVSVCIIVSGCNNSEQILLKHISTDADFEIAFTPLVLGLKANEVKHTKQFHLPSIPCFSLNALKDITPLNGLNLTKPWVFRKEKNRHAYHLIIPLFDQQAWRICAENDLKCAVTKNGNWNTCSHNDFCEPINMIWDNHTLIVSAGDSIQLLETSTPFMSTENNSDISITIAPEYFNQIIETQKNKTPVFEEITANINFNKGELSIDLKTPILDSTERNKWFFHECKASHTETKNKPFLSICNAIKLESLDNFLNKDYLGIFEGLKTFHLVLNGFKSVSETAISYDYDEDFNPVEIKKTKVIEYPNIDLSILKNENYSGIFLQKLSETGIISKNTQGAYESILLNQVSIIDAKNQIRIGTNQPKEGNALLTQNEFVFKLHALLPDAANDSYNTLKNLFNSSITDMLCRKIDMFDISTSRELKTSITLKFRDSETNGLSQLIEIFEQLYESREIVMK